MNITAHGLLGAVLVFLACAGIVTIGTGIEEWLSDRLALDLNPARIGSFPVLPRRLRISRRLVRPGARLALGDGRGCYVMHVLRDADAGGIAEVQPFEADDEEAWSEPEWARFADLSPLPLAAAAGDAA